MCLFNRKCLAKGKLMSHELDTYPPSKAHIHVTFSSFANKLHDRKYWQTLFPQRIPPLYTHMPGAFPALSPSMASANCGPRPSSLTSLTGYMYVLNEKRIACVLGSRVRVCNSVLSHALAFRQPNLYQEALDIRE